MKTTLQQQEKKKIVFPEATDERVLRAASRLAQEGLVEPILIGNINEINQLVQEYTDDVSNCTLIDPSSYAEVNQVDDSFIERRNGMVSKEEAEMIVKDENYFGTMLVYLKKAVGLVSGAAHSTSDTVRTALQIIKTKEGVQKTSGVFVMVRDDEKYIFADCAINIAPTSEVLVGIAMEMSRTAKLFY